MAINYTKVGWDTSKYVNPTNMNQMDNGIKAACDGVDNAVMNSSVSTQTVAATGDDTPLRLTSNSATRSWLQLNGSSGGFGKLGIGSGDLPLFRTSGGTEKRLFCNADGYTWQLAAGTPITATSDAHADLNTYATEGTYYMTANNAAYVDNKPTTSGNRFTLIVMRVGNNSSSIRQVYMYHGSSSLFTRVSINGGTTWTAWDLLVTDAQLNSYVKLSNAGNQKIINTASERSVLTLMSGNATQSLIAFQNNVGNPIGLLGIINDKPVYLKPDLSEHELMQLDVLKSVVAASTDFADFKTRIAAL